MSSDQSESGTDRSDDYQLAKADASRKWHWYELDADECFCGNVKEFAITDRADPGSFGTREVSQICKQKFRTATEQEVDGDA